MDTLIKLINAHKTTDALVVYMLFSNFVTALPSPSNSSNGFYKWFFAFSNGLGGSLSRVFPKLRLPGDPTAGQPTYFAKTTDTGAEAPKP